MSGDARKSALDAAPLRAARALLRMSAAYLATASGVSLVTIRRVQALDGSVRMMRANLEAIRCALEAAGVEFINGDAPGVRLRRRSGG